MYRTYNPSAPGMHNMPDSRDSHMRVSYKDNPGFFQNIQQSFCASLFGILLVIASFPVIYWNEGRAVQTALSLDEGLKQVVHLTYIDQVSPEYQDKLVHLTGSLQTDKVLSDADYGIAVQAVKLRRKVEMYQWVEHKHTREYDEGGRKRTETTFSYSTDWKDHVVGSNSFDNPSGHQNPNSMPVDSYTKEADFVRVGAFVLSKALIGKISDFQPLSLREVPYGKAMYLHNGMFYHAMDPYHPRVGDVRVQFSFAGLSGKPGSGLGEPMKVSIVARQHGATLSHYHTKSGDSLELLYPGEMSAEEIFNAEQSANTALTWVLRGVGWILMFLGFQMMTSILVALISWLPVVRELVGLGLTLLTLCLATSLTLVTIAIGWIAHRPLLGLTLLAAAAVPILLSRRRAQAANHRKT